MMNKALETVTRIFLLAVIYVNAIELVFISYQYSRLVQLFLSSKSNILLGLASFIDNWLSGFSSIYFSIQPAWFPLVLIVLSVIGLAVLEKRS